MRHNSIRLAVFVGLVLSVVAALALAAQDKYTVKVPGGLAFSEFRGYEAWQAISISRNERVVAVILGNPVMIDAYRAGIPGNGKPVPDGAKMAKVHWTPKRTSLDILARKVSLVKRKRPLAASKPMGAFAN